MSDKMREAFENYASNGGKFPKAIERFAGEYNLMQTASAWWTWKLAWGKAQAQTEQVAERPSVGGCRMNKVWVVGKFVAETETKSVAWEFQGVYEKECDAVAACEDGTYFIGPATLNKRIGNETVEWAGCYYPLA